MTGPCDQSAALILSANEGCPRLPEPSSPDPASAANYSFLWYYCVKTFFLPTYNLNLSRLLVITTNCPRRRPWTGGSTPRRPRASATGSSRWALTAPGPDQTQLSCIRTWSQYLLSVSLHHIGSESICVGALSAGERSAKSFAFLSSSLFFLDSRDINLRVVIIRFWPSKCSP